MGETSSKPKHIPYTQLLRQWDYVLSGIVVLLVFFWAYFVIPEIALPLFLSLTNLLNSKLFSFLLSAGLGLSIVKVFLRFVLGDPVLRGNSRFSRFFRSEFPSQKISADLKLSSGEATRLWLDYYDCWQYTSEPNYNNYRETTRTGYWCRTVFVVSRLLVGLMVLSLPSIGITLAREGLTSVAALQKITVFLIVLLLFGVLAFANRLPKSPASEPTGCWRAWRQKCMENYEAFRSDLKDVANGDVEALRQRVRTKREELARAAA